MFVVIGGLYFLKYDNHSREVSRGRTLVNDKI